MASAREWAEVIVAGTFDTLTADQQEVVEALHASGHDDLAEQVLLSSSQSPATNNEAQPTEIAEVLHGFARILEQEEDSNSPGFRSAVVDLSRFAERLRTDALR